MFDFCKVRLKNLEHLLLKGRILDRIYYMDVICTNFSNSNGRHALFSNVIDDFYEKDNMFNF